METNSILPTSPNQTRQFLLENEEILFIGSAKEKYNHLNIIERTRWIALTDQGRLLIMYTPDTKTSDSVSNSPQLARASFRDGKRPLMGSRRSSIEHKPEDIVPKSPAPLRASFSAGFKRRLSIKDTSNEKESSYPEDLVDDQDVPHTPKSRRASFRASFQRKSATLPSITPAAPTKSGESSAVISRDASFLIEEENVYVTYGTKIHKAMVTSIPHDVKTSTESIPGNLLLLSVVLIDKLTELKCDKGCLTIAREDQKFKLFDCPANEWQSRIEMAASLSI